MGKKKVNYKVNYKDIGERAIKTFAQTFVATLLAGVFIIQDWNTLWTLLIASGAAGISATWNFVKETL